MTPQEASLTCICGESDCTVPYGLCHCGCKRKTPIPRTNDRYHGRIVGVPVRYIYGHSRRIRPVVEVALPFKIQGVYCRLIPLTRGLYAIVEQVDYERLMQWKWCASYCKATRSYIGSRHSLKEEPWARKTNILMHREVLGLSPTDLRRVDHIESGETLKNIRPNLRFATPSQNMMNTRLRKNNKSGHKGVSWDKRAGDWWVQLNKDHKCIYSEHFDDLLEAAEAYKTEARKHFGEFARFS